MASARSKNLALQLDALRAGGCETVFEDQGVSGAVIERAGLKAHRKSGRAAEKSDP
jgi:hypothetical protein